MAGVGMLHPVVARVSSYTDGQEPTYSAGMVIGHAIQGDLALSRNNNPLYGDDVIVEDDNSVTSAQLTLGVDDLVESVQTYMLAVKKKTANNQDDYYLTAGAAPVVGVGFCRVLRRDGVTVYNPVWLYRAVFGRDAENAATKGESINWQTPTVTGRCMGTYIDNDGEPVFYRARVYPASIAGAAAAALAWLDQMAGISSASQSASESTPAAGESSGTGT